MKKTLSQNGSFVWRFKMSAIIAAVLTAMCFLTCSNPTSSEYGLDPNNPGTGNPGGGNSVYGSCTVGGNCTNNVLQSSCNGSFVANGTCPTQTLATEIKITLTSWRTTSTGGTFDNNNSLDPRIHFIVRSYSSSGSRLSSNTTGYLLDATDIPGNWTGSRSSAWIPFTGTASRLEIEAVAIEKNPLIDDDYSPQEYLRINLPVYRGATGSATLGSATTTQSRIGFNYEFR